MFPSFCLQENVYPFTSGGTLAAPIACSISNGALKLTSQANTETSSAGWLNNAYRVVNGFRVIFQFQVTAGTPEGFAFVMQSTSKTVVGGASANLGYNFANNVAIEFDMYTDSTIVDTAGSNHVEVHTVYNSGGNSASNNGFLLATSNSNPGVTMRDGALHTATINYIPASSASGTNGAITVQIDSGSVLTTAIDSDRVAAMFTNGVAYLGFTASTSASIAADLTISNFQLFTVQVDPTQTYATSGVSSGQAANDAKSTPQGTIQLVDKCGSALPLSYGAGAISVSVTTDGTNPSASGGSAFQDNNNGQYYIYWWNKVAAIPSSQYQLVVKYYGTNIAGSPFVVQVVPGVPNGPASSVTAIQSTFTAGVPQAVTVTLKDRLGNAAPRPSNWYIAAGFQSSYDVINQYTAASGSSGAALANFNFNLQSNTATSNGVSVLVRVYAPDTTFGDVAGTPKTVNVVAGAATGAKSGLSGNGISTATAHTQASVTLNVNDAYGNPVSGTTGVSVAGTITPQGGGAAVALGVAYSSGNAWTLTYTRDVSANYIVAATVNGAAAQNTGTPFVQPNVVTRGDILSQIPNGQTGATTSFQIQAYDGYNNPRVSQNDAGQDFSLTVTSAGGFSLTLPCATQSTPSTNAYVSVFRCTYQVSGYYQVDIVPLKTQSYSFALSVAGGTASTLKYSTIGTVTAGAASAAQSSVSGIPATTVAGVPSTFTLTIRDANGNIRSGVDDTGYITQTQVAIGSTTFATINSVTGNNAGIYTISYTCGLIGSYVVNVKISGVSVPGGGTTTNVPGAMVPANSLITGAGTNGGVGGRSATLTVQARDNYQNNLLQPSNSQNAVYVTTKTATGSAVQTACTGDSSVGGKYTCLYTVPAYNAGDPSFTLTVYGTPAGGAAAVAGTFQAQEAQDTSFSNRAGCGHWSCRPESGWLSRDLHHHRP